MKDYRLSEIKNADLPELAGNFELTHIKFFLKEITIEPRDMVELPYKQEIKFSEERSEWQVVWRDDFIQRIRFADFPTEPEADAFLAELKGGKK